MPIRPTPHQAKSAATPAPGNAELEHLERTAPQIVVVMVHGTFARNAEWVKPESRFGVALRQALAPALVVPSRWSGGNSVRARAEGVQKLRSDIEELRRQYPNAQHAVVAHSHGGNIALVVMDETLAKAKGTLGVATLSTPFLSATMRHHESMFGPLDGIAAAMFAGIAVFAVGAALGHGRTWWLAGLLTFAAVALSLLAAAEVTRRMRRHAQRICGAMPSTALTPDQLTIVRTSSDEAAAALSGARVAGGFAALFWSFMAGGVVELLKDTLQKVDYFGIREIQRQVTKYSDDDRPSSSAGDTGFWKKSFRESVVPYLPLLIFTLLDDANAWARWVGVVVAVLYGLPALGALLVSIVSIPFSVIFSLGLLPCGWTLPFAGPYLDLTAEPAPPGTWAVTQLPAGGETSFSHGRSHDDDEAISFVCGWLKERLEAAEGRVKSAERSQVATV
jgi:hypothetical protein